MKRKTSFASAGAKCIGAARGAKRPAVGFFIGCVVVGLWASMTAAQAQTSGSWQAQDIGVVAAAGSSSASGGVFTVAGSGADIWSTSDAFHFYAQTLSGDGTITARVAGITDTNGWAKAGVMIRDSLAANASNVFLAATPEWHGIVAQQRTSTGGDTASVPGPAVYTPYWLRLTRSGSGITAATSPDGATWTTTGTFSTAMGASVYIGLAVTSHNDGTLCTATFDNVSVVSTAPSGPPGAPMNLTATAVSSTQVNLAWTAADNRQTRFSVERSTGGAFQQVGTTAADTTTYTDSGLAPGVTYFYQVRAGNTSGVSSASNVASATTSDSPPSGSWQSIDIGTNTAGQTSVSGDAVTLTGSGRDIWNTADGFRYYYQRRTDGDCEMIVHVASLTNTNGWAKAGIMLRESLDPGSEQVWISVSAEHGTTFQWRETANGDTRTSTPSEDGGPPRWLKLVFRAQVPDPSEPAPPTVMGYASTDGQTWTHVGTFWFSSTGRPYIGLAVTSHNDGALCTAQFDHLKYLSAPPAPTDFQVTHRGPNGEIDLKWSYSTTDVDQFVIRTNAETTDHEWRVAATVPGTAREAVITMAGSAKVQIKAFRDLVRSPETAIWVSPTIAPSLAVTGTTSSSASLRVLEEFNSMARGPEGGPWSIERSTDGVNFQEIASGVSPTGATLSTNYADYTDSGLPPDVTRYYRARELRPNGDSSAYSTIVSATTALSGALPAAPTGFGLIGVSPAQLDFGWTDNATNETGYQIERSTDGTSFTLLATLPADSTRYADTTFPPSTTCYYRVRAVNDLGFVYSNTISLKTPVSVAGLPVAPTGLTATALSSSQIQLNWTDNATNETSYEVQRSQDGVNFGISYGGGAANMTSMMNVGLNASTTYYYRVRAVNSAGASAFSNIAQATTPATSSPPPGETWQSGDVGPVVLTGSDSTSGGTVTVNGEGSDIWDNVDSFHFRYQALNGDGSITARVVSMTNTSVWAKAGVMIRNSLAAGARNVFAAVTPAGAGVVAQVRDTDGGSTSYTPGPSANAPYWLRLTRAGTTFTAQASSDGIAWTTYATFNVTMDTSVVVGLAVTSHDQNALCTATFDNVTVSAAGTPPPPPPPSGTWSAADIGGIGVAGSNTASGSTITIQGSGTDIWDTADSFRFVWQTRTGDGVVEAQVASMDYTNGWAKAGVMIRDSVNANAPNVFVALTPTFHGIVAQARSTAGAETAQSAGPVVNAPYWVRLARTGDTFTASSSPDGVTWTSFATFNVTMSATANFGFAVTSHDNAQLNQAVFQNPYIGGP